MILIYRVTSIIVLIVTYLVYRFNLDYKDFSIIPYSITHSDIDYRYTLIYRLTYSNVDYSTLPLNLVREAPLVYIT